MVSRRRRTIFAVLVTACALAAGAAFAAGVRKEDPRVKTSAASLMALTSARTARRPVILFLSKEHTGQLAVAPLGPAPGRPTFEPMSCARVSFAGGQGLCVGRSTGIVPGYSAEVFGPDLRVRHTLALAGVPSRARVSPDGRYGSVTMFVTGDSYAAPGAFSTVTTLIDMATGEQVANLEQFTVTRAGRQVTAVDVNYWGVTFARDSDRFYATLATGGHTYLIEGSMSGRVAHVIHENVECPSLSPDGRRLVFKRRTSSHAQPWRLTVLDLSTMRETPLAETRSVDDQAEWLDDNHVLYARDGEIWGVSTDGRGRSRRFVAEAGSPAVVRW